MRGGVGMDKFTEAMEKMSQMPEEQYKTLINLEKKKICICRNCPSFNQCMEEDKEALFCILGKSSCDVTIAECNCLECPAHSNFDMRHKSYCVEGSEEEQRNK
ncbi:MAG: hypothetical protein A4E25_00639 [Methanobacterium sp. PtaB.Bin024]|nr:MAG: hypothetical protein A4E25_00639 [Methanobacterium sp. PtaB.Bin024]